MRGRTAVLCLGLLGAPAGATAQGFTATDIYLITITHPDSLTFDLSSLRNATPHPGYDNQPCFTPDGRALVYASEAAGQTDIRRLDLASGASTAVRETPESEFSPVLLPDGSGIAVVRVEPDSSQRVWRLPADGSEPAPILPDIREVGYQAWLDDHRCLLFILGQPFELILADTRDGTHRKVAENIGRCLLPVPGGRRVSFVQNTAEGREIRVLEPDAGTNRLVAPGLPGSEDVAWTPGGQLLMAQGYVIAVWNPEGEGAWETILSLAGSLPGEITRMAVSPDGTRLAMVVVEPAAP